MILTLFNKLKKAFGFFVLSPVLLVFLTGCAGVKTCRISLASERLTVHSPWFYVSDDDVDLQEAYSGFDPSTQQRFSHLTIGDKAIDMINNSSKVILASTFLFDVFYSEDQPQRDIVEEITAAVVQKKKSNPGISVVLILDPVNRAYGRRIGPAVKTLLENGVDVFYSDLLSTRSATALGLGQLGNNILRFADTISFGIYMVIREDIIYSKKLDMVDWSNNSKAYKQNFLTDVLPPLPQSQINTLAYSSSSPVAVSFATESCIRRSIIEMLENAREDDLVRIQMFYLSDFKVIKAIIKTAKRLKKPMLIILDPSNDAFGMKKDGTPNRQVAAYLMKKKKQLGLNIEIRWYDTHGEQNHAKIMSITNTDPARQKYELINGSANWTGKNLKDINLEANICLKGSKKVVNKFNTLFDLFWQNSDGMVYTIDYHGKYEAHTGLNKWKNGERWGYVAW